MIYKGVKIVPDNHFTKIGQMCVRLDLILKRAGSTFL